MARAAKTFTETVLRNPLIPHRPFPRQARFLLCPALEALYGGAAGGGKSDSLLMAALQYAHVPGYAALLLRRSYADLAMPGALMERSREWLEGKAHWNENDKRWTFASGATLSFGYLQHPQDRFRYQSSEFQFVGFDELTQFEEIPYRFLFSRLRRRQGMPVPLRMRAATNPGGRGHQWVKARFLTCPQDRQFVPARLDDNPALDREQYVRSLAHLPPVTRQQILRGDWDVKEGSLFNRAWFRVADEPPRDLEARVRRWDLAATEQAEGSDPDWTAGVLMGRDRHDGYWVLDVCRLRASPARVEDLVRQTAEVDGRSVPVEIEQEPGSAGKSLVDHYLRNVLPGWQVTGVPSTGDKVTRASPLAAMAEPGHVRLARGSWNLAFLDELESFPGGGHDDQVDAAAGAFRRLSAGVAVPVVHTAPPRPPGPEANRPSLTGRLRGKGGVQW